MFVFGNPEEIARTFIESVAVNSPGFSSTPVWHQVEDELRVTLVVLRMAIKMANKEDADKATRDILLDMHDHAYIALAATSEEFAQQCKSGKYSYPNIKTKENKKRYIYMAEQAKNIHPLLSES